jgi:phosphonopyruvate decarboxylase
MPTRQDIVKEIMDNVSDEDIVIASTGYISRAVFEYKDRPLNFYMMGSMGAALGIGIGLAMNVKGKVFVINGDGSALMSLGTTATFRKYNLPNLWHFIINNNCHESTGGQPTAFQHAWIEDSFNTCVFDAERDSYVPKRITLEPEEITKRFMDAVKSLCQ